MQAPAAPAPAEESERERADDHDDDSAHYTDGDMDSNVGDSAAINRPVTDAQRK